MPSCSAASTLLFVFYTAGRVSHRLDLPIITADVGFQKCVVDKETKGMRWGKGSHTAVTDRKYCSYMNLICLLLKK